MNKNGYIALIGLPGCGKSTIAKILADKLCLPTVDVDDRIVELAGATIPELFAQSEDLFRDWETRALASIAAARTVVACGGGIINRPENIGILARNGVTVYIDRPVEMIVADIDTSGRPLLADGRARVYALQQEREPLYRKAADITVVNNTTLEETADKIILALNELE